MLPLPDLRDGGLLSAYTLSLWVHFGIRSPSGGIIIEQGTDINSP